MYTQKSSIIADLNRDYEGNDTVSPEEAKKLGRMNNIMSPHRYQDEKDIYGQNVIYKVAMNPGTDIKKWPKPPTLVMNCDRSSITDFYENMSNNMKSQYTKACIKNGLMKTYDEIVNQSELIDIAGLYPSEDSRLTSPDIKFSKENLEFLKRHSWYAFCPCFVSFTVKTNRKRYSHIELLSIDEQKKSFTIRMSEYIGDKYDWIIHAQTTTTYTFDYENGCLSMTYDWSDALMYEEILTASIKQCGWSKQQIQFWLDTFGVNFIDKIVCVTMTFPKDTLRSDDEKESETGQIPVTLASYEDIPFIQKNFRIGVEIRKKGEEAADEMREELVKMLIKSYMHTISAVNLKLFSEPRTETGKTDMNRNVYKFRDMTVKSTVYPVVPSEHRIIKIKQRKDK